MYPQKPFPDYSEGMVIDYRMRTGRIGKNYMTIMAILLGSQLVNDINEDRATCVHIFLAACISARMRGCCFTLIHVDQTFTPFEAGIRGMILFEIVPEGSAVTRMGDDSVYATTVVNMCDLLKLQKRFERIYGSHVQDWAFCVHGPDIFYNSVSSDGIELAYLLTDSIPAIRMEMQHA